MKIIDNFIIGTEYSCYDSNYLHIKFIYLSFINDHFYFILRNQQTDNYYVISRSKVNCIIDINDCYVVELINNEMNILYNTSKGICYDKNWKAKHFK